MKSQYRTTCPECQQVIKVGADIEKVGLDWVHAACVAAHTITVANRRAARNAEIASLVERMNACDDTIGHARQPNGRMESMGKSDAGLRELRAWVAEHEEWVARKSAA